MASKADIEKIAYEELLELVPELGGWSVAGLIIGTSARLAGKQSVENGDLVAALHTGMVLARDYGFKVEVDAHSKEFITALAGAVGAKAAATVIGAAVGAKAVDGF